MAIPSSIDIHMCLTPAPTPLPTPHLSVVFDPFDYMPVLGATITVCGMTRATAGTSGIAVPHPARVPLCAHAATLQKDDELFMGSATVVADGDPFSYIALPVLNCQIASIPSDHGEEWQVRTKSDRIYHFRKEAAFTNAEGLQEVPLALISDLCGNWLSMNTNVEVLGRIWPLGMCVATKSMIAVNSPPGSTRRLSKGGRLPAESD